MRSARFWIVAALLAGTALLLAARGDTDVIPVSEPLAQVPRSISGWTSRDIHIDQQTLEVLGAGDFLSRLYASPENETAPIGLFIGYFPTQRTGVTIHSPKHCLPGAGWVFESSKYVDLPRRLWKETSGRGVHRRQRDEQAVCHLLVSGAWAQCRQ